MAAAAENGAIWIWDVGTQILKHVLRGHTGQVGNAYFYADGARLLSLGDKGEAVLWDVRSGEAYARLNGHTKYVSAAAFHPDANTVATSSWDGTVRLWELHTGNLITTLSNSPGALIGGGGVFEGKINFVSFSRDGTYLASAAGGLLPHRSSLANIWKTKADFGVVLHGFETRNDTRRSGFPGARAEFSPDGRFVVSTQIDNRARLWNLQDGKEIFALGEGDDRVMHAGFSADGRLLLSVAGGVASIWRLEGADVSRITIISNFADASPKGSDGLAAIMHASFDRLAQRIITASWDGRARIWDVASGQLLYTLRGHRSAVLKALFSPNGSVVATSGFDHEARLWDASTGDLKHVLQGHSGTITDISFDPKGKLLATVSQDQSVRLWDLNSGACVSILRGHTGEVRSVDFDPSGTRVVSGAWDGSVRVWDVKSDRQLSVFADHAEGVEGVRFSPSASRVATASRDGTSRVVDADTGREVAILRGHKIGRAHV